MADWKQTLARLAPTVATALGGPLAGLAVNTIAERLGLEPDEEAVAQAVSSGSPEVLYKLKEAEHDFKLRMKELGLKEDALYIEDTASARRAYTKHKDPMVQLLAVLIVLGFMAVVGLVLAGQFVVSGALAGTLVGYMSAKAEQVVAFYFGSSAGSKQKTEAMAQAFSDQGSIGASRRSS